MYNMNLVSSEHRHKRSHQFCLFSAASLPVRLFLSQFIHILYFIFTHNKLFIHLITYIFIKSTRQHKLSNCYYQTKWAYKDFSWVLLAPHLSRNMKTPTLKWRKPRSLSSVPEKADCVVSPSSGDGVGTAARTRTGCNSCLCQLSTWAKQPVNWLTVTAPEPVNKQLFWWRQQGFEGPLESWMYYSTLTLFIKPRITTCCCLRVFRGNWTRVRTE